MGAVQLDGVPVYEAVVCGFVLDRMKAEEMQTKNEELLKNVADWCTSYRDLMETYPGLKAMHVDREDIIRITPGMAVLVELTRPVTEKIRGRLNSVSIEYRRAIESMLNEIDSYSDQLDEILEAWMMALDENLVNRIKEAVDQVDSKKEQESKSWEDVLASIHN